MQFDYVIVGGGSAGSVLAARLSENPDLSVCLLEAGGSGRSILVRAPAGAVAMLGGRPRKINNWGFETVPQAGLNGRKGYQPRGRALGGSSAINAMLYLRGHRLDYDGWVDQGCAGWGWQDVLPFFKKAENNQHGADDMHGGSGPLQVTDQQSPRPVSRAFVEAATQMQHRASADFNTGENSGAGLYQVTQFHNPARNGQRCSAAAAYLPKNVRSRTNLTILTRARVTKILFEGTRATGVAFRHDKADKTANAKHEVILCGGALNSPQLLQLSGIGRAQDLQKLGIPVLHDLQGVGQNLQDHIDYTLGYRSKDRDNFGISLRGSIDLLGHIRRWRKDGTGMIATPFAEAGAFLKTDPSLPRPDIQLHFVIAIIDDHSRKLHLGHGFSCHVCVLQPHSRGRVFLQSGNPLAAPGIDPNFLSDPRDMTRLIAGAKMTRDILRAPALAPFRHKEMYISGEPDDAEWEHHIRSRADTVYHPVGTCKMGVDRLAVVDPQLRVHGIQGLRVVDASVMPSVISGNTNAPTIMIAERAATFILDGPGCYPAPQ